MVNIRKMTTKPIISLHAAVVLLWVFLLSLNLVDCEQSIVVNTWKLVLPAQTAFKSLQDGESATDAIVNGCHQCENVYHACGTTIGYGGSPDENGETTLDAMIMDGKTHDVGAVGDLRGVKSAIQVAQAVMKYTKHTILAGKQASAFAAEMGFHLTNLSTTDSLNQWHQWQKSNCQPNYRQNVQPDPSKSCGPYKPLKLSENSRSHSYEKEAQPRFNAFVNENNHDTIAMLAMDKNGDLAAGTTTNGAAHKVPGRIGDSPIMGAGAYVDNDVGAAGATGDGDVMMRFLPSYAAVSQMEKGDSPTTACKYALDKIFKFYPKFSGALVALNKRGEHGGACRGFSYFEYTYQAANMTAPKIVKVPCVYN